MNFCLKMKKQMATKKHNIIVIGIAIVISIAILLFRSNENHSNPDHLDYRVYTVINGWGYDILVNGELFIHQESVPAVTGNHPFPDKEKAKQAAQLVINKIKKGQSPGITKEEALQFK
jgi:hypothetical protein